MKIAPLLIGFALAWMIGVDTSNIPISQLTCGQVFRNLAALFVLWLFWSSALMLDKKE